MEKVLNKDLKIKAYDMIDSYFQITERDSSLKESF